VFLEALEYAWWALTKGNYFQAEKVAAHFGGVKSQEARGSQYGYRRNTFEIKYCAWVAIKALIATNNLRHNHRLFYGGRHVFPSGFQKKLEPSIDKVEEKMNNAESTKT